MVIFDTSGQDEYDKLRPLFYKDSNVIIMCYSIDMPDSLSNIFDKWWPEIRYYVPQIPVILVGIKKDLRNDPITSRRLKLTNQRSLKYEDGQLVSKRLRVAYFFECSCKTNENIQEIFQAAAKLSLNENKHILFYSMSSSSIKIRKKSKRKILFKNCSIL